MALIKERLAVDVGLTPGRTGQFEVKADDETVATRGGNWFTQSFGGGYPDLGGVVDLLERRLAGAAPPGG